MIERDTICIDGSWVPSGGTGTIEVFGAATEEVVGRENGRLGFEEFLETKSLQR